MGAHPFTGRHGADLPPRAARAAEPWQHWYLGTSAPLARRGIQLRTSPPPSIIEGSTTLPTHEQRAHRVGFARHVLAWFCVQMARLFAALARWSAGTTSSTTTIPVPPR